MNCDDFNVRYFILNAKSSDIDKYRYQLGLAISGMFKRWGEEANSLNDEFRHNELDFGRGCYDKG